MSVQAIEPIKIPLPDEKTNVDINNLLGNCLIDKESINNTRAIDDIVYKLYDISKTEIEFIESL